ncbi:MAG: OsmC family protein [Deltaproteobacteria bacterium]|nr:OsmC family protein [Deltaproteobacteria bacterium]
MKKNNVDLAAIAATVQRAKDDPKVAQLDKRIEGAWSAREGTPQFSAPLRHGTSETVLRADMAPSFGGAGLAPDPLQYMLFGLAACYTATVVMLASMEGAELEDVRAVAENVVEAAPIFDLAEGPLVPRVAVRVEVRASVDDATLARWASVARAKCPFAFTVANAVPLETSIVRRS